MQCQWLTEAKQAADKLAVDGMVYYIAETGQYTPWPEQEGYAVVSIIEIEKLAKEFALGDNSFPSDYDADDLASDYCIYATDDSIEANLEPKQEEVEYYLDGYYTDHYQRYMRRGDSTIAVMFYAKVRPSWSGKIDDLIDQIKEKELADNPSAYPWAIERAIDRRIAAVEQGWLEWAWECWSEQVRDDYYWITDIGLVGQSGGHVMLIMSWPETTEELAERVQDCKAIEADIKAAITGLESEEFRLEEYRVAFDIETETIGTGPVVTSGVQIGAAA